MLFGIKTSELKYIGGPLDGLRQMIPRGAPAELIAIPINANLLRALDGQPRGPKLPATSVAVYQLGTGPGGPEYRFLGSTPTKEFHLEHWMG